MTDRTRVFISCVTAEFGGLRETLRRYLSRADCEVKIQEDFRQVPVDTLEKLDRYIRRCAAMIHIVGEESGARPTARAIERYVAATPDFLACSPVLRDDVGDISEFSFVQWEALLAIHHKVPLFVYRAAAAAAPQSHLDRLRIEGRYAVTFESASDLLGLLIGDLREIVPALPVEVGAETAEEGTRQSPAVYLERLAERCRTLRFVDSNALIELDRLFVPPRASLPAVRAAAALLPIEEEGGAAELADAVELASRGARTLFVGPVGSGKTSLLHHLVLRELGREVPRRPILLHLATVRGGLQALLREMRRSVSELGWPVDERSLVKACREGEVLLALDALDEVPSAAREEVFSAIRSFAASYPECQILLTSRRAEDASLLPEFDRYALEPLSDEQVAAFVESWSRERPSIDREELLEFIVRAETSAGSDLLDPTMADYAAAMVRALAEVGILAPIFGSRALTRPLGGSLARNPLSLTLLCVAFQHSARPVTGLTELLRVVTTTLIERVVESPAAAFQTGARATVAEVIHAGRAIAAEAEFSGAAFLSQRRIIELIDDSSAADLDDLEIEALRLALVDSGLLLRDTEGSHRFAHRSLQEYLAATFLAGSPHLAGKLAKRCFESSKRTIALHCASSANGAAFMRAFREELEDIARGDEHVFELLSWATSRARESPPQARTGVALCHLILWLARLRAPTPLLAATRTAEEWFRARGFDPWTDAEYLFTNIGKDKVVRLARWMGLSSLEESARGVSDDEERRAETSRLPIDSLERLTLWLLGFEVLLHAARRAEVPAVWTEHLPCTGVRRGQCASVELSPLSAEDFCAIAAVESEDDRKRELIDEAIRRQPESPIGYRERGWLLHSRGEWQAARLDLETATRLSTGAQRVECAALLSGSLKELGEEAAAVAFLTEALDAHPVDVPEALPNNESIYRAAAWAQLGTCHVRLEEWDRALADFEEAKRFGADLEDYASWLGCAAASVGRREEATRWYEISVARDPGYALGYFHLSRLYARADPRRRLCLDRAAQLLGDHPIVVRAQALDHESRGELEDAFERYGRLSSLAPDDHEGWCGTARVLLKCGRIESALEPIERAIELDGSCAVARLYRAFLRSKAGDGEMSRRDAAEARELCNTPLERELLELRWHHLQQLREQFFLQLERVVAIPGGADAVADSYYGVYSEEPLFERILRSAS